MQDVIRYQLVHKISTPVFYLLDEWLPGYIVLSHYPESQVLLMCSHVCPLPEKVCKSPIKSA